MSLAKFVEDINETNEENKSAFDSRKTEVSFLSKVTPPRYLKLGFVRYNSQKKRVEIHFDNEESDDIRNTLASQKWNYHPSKKFWSKGCSAKMKIKDNIAFATDILER